MSFTFSQTRLLARAGAARKARELVKSAEAMRMAWCADGQDFIRFCRDQLEQPK